MNIIYKHVVNKNKQVDSGLRRTTMIQIRWARTSKVRQLPGTPELPCCESGVVDSRILCVRNSAARSAAMFDPKILDDLSKKLSESLPAGLREMRADIDKNAKAALQSALAKLDLVTREEFDVQTAVLARSRALLDALAQRVADLEKQLLNK